LRLGSRRHRDGARALRYAAAACAALLAASAAAARPGDDVGAAAAARTLATYRAVPRFTPPGPSFDARRAIAGATIVEIPITSQVPFVTAVEDGMRRAARAAGARLVVYPNQGTPGEWADGIRSAISRRADAITLLAQDPALVAPQIAQARRAGIPVVVVRTSGEGEPCPADRRGRPYGAACVPGPFERAGRLQADWVIAASRGRADVLVVTSRDARSTTPLLRGLRSEFAARCASCRLRFVDVPIASWATLLRGAVQTALLRDPGIDYVIPTYDSMSQYVAPAIRAAGKAGQVRIATFNGTPFVLRMLQDGDVVAMDVGENLAWLGWAAMDQTFRAVAGLRPVAGEHTPLRVFDERNVAETGRPPRSDMGYGAAYVQGYRRLWGLV
jgi:ribose transport system substrate-binding protein